MARPDALLKVYNRILTPQAQQARRWLAGPACRVLEVGCSAGYFSARLAEAGHTVWSTDLSAEHLAAVKSNFPRLAPFRAIMEQLPCRSASLDAIVALEVIEHTQRDRAAIAEAARLLRPGGRLVLTTPNKGLLAFMDPFNVKTAFCRSWPRLAAMTNRLQRLGDTQLTDNIAVHRHYGVPEIDRLLRSAFRIVRLQRTGLALFPLASAGYSVVSRILDTALPLVMLQCLMSIDGAIDCGQMGYNLMVLAERR